jgi:glycosyltransferase involved in cell wall biosynthesis
MNLPDEKLFAPSPNGASSWGRNFTLIYAGTIAERYGIDTAIRALPLLVPAIPGIKLRILNLGSETFRAQLQRLAEELAVAEHVSFEPAVPVDEVAAEYRSADVGICPHNDQVFNEIYFSTKVAEYVTVGLPAVVARSPVMAYYFDDSQVAFFAPGNHVEFAECVRRIYEDEAYRKSLVENGAALMQRWNWSRERAHLVDTVEKLRAPLQRPV